jgi:hypothetical protein
MDSDSFSLNHDSTPMDSDSFSLNHDSTPMDGDSTELNRMSSVGAEVKLDPLRKFRPASQGEPNGRAAWFPSLREGDLQEGGSS